MKVVYVAGSMRSGTTLVAELLGSFEGAIAVGEINNLALAARTGQRCSCGNAPSSCRLWRPVFGELLTGKAADEISRLRRRLERQRRLPELVRLAGRAEANWPADVAEYVGFLRSVVRLLLESSGAVTLIDSSKSATGAALMRLAQTDELAVLHLLRNPRGVAYSEAHNVHGRDEWTTAPPMVRSILRSATGWDTVNLECYLVARIVGHWTGAWYESLCDSPRERLGLIARQLGLEGDGPIFEDARVCLGPSHVLVGNPNRIVDNPSPTGADWRTVKRDDEWQRGLTWAEKVLTGLLVWPFEQVLRRLIRDDDEAGDLMRSKRRS